MIKIEKKPYGYKIFFSGIISSLEVENWLTESSKILEKSPEKFSVFVDMQEMEILPVICQGNMYEGQKLYRKMGMERSVVIVRDRLTAMQFRLIAQKTGIYDYERYINASVNPIWEKEALDWLINSVEPSCDDELVKQK